MDQAEEAAIEAAWRYLLSEDLDVPFSTIVAFVRAQCPEVSVKRIRAAFDRRLRARHGLERRSELPEEVLKGTGAPAQNKRIDGRPQGSARAF
jgi:hypothetical protein